MDAADPLKNRKVTLMHGSLIVHDIVLKCYSHNHAKIYFFPTASPRVAFDRDHNLTVFFGSCDYIKFAAQDFSPMDSWCFRWGARSLFYRNGTRSIPDVDYTGQLPCMMTINWSYPPLDGFLDLYNQTEKVGRIPTSILYQKQKDCRTKPLFEKSGLLDYLKDIYAGKKIECRYSPEVQRSIRRLLN